MEYDLQTDGVHRSCNSFQKKGITRSRSGIKTNPLQARRYLHPRAQNVAHTLFNREPMLLVQLHLATKTTPPGCHNPWRYCAYPARSDWTQEANEGDSIDRRGVGVSPGTQPGRAG